MGLFHEDKAVKHLFENESFDTHLTEFISKTHKIDVDKWMKHKGHNELFFVMSERQNIGKKVDDKFRKYKNVLIFPYTDLLETDIYGVENIVKTVYTKLSSFLPGETVSEMKMDRAVKRIKDMNALYKTIKDKPFSYYNKYYHIHGSHRSQDSDIISVSKD